MPRWISCLLATAAASGLFVSPTLAVSFVNPLVDRGVITDADVISPSGSDVETAELLNAGVGPFGGSVSASALIFGSAGSAYASQLSDIDAASASVAGFGTSDASGSATDLEALGDFLSESYFFFEFEVDMPTPYLLTGRLTAASAFADAFAGIDFGPMGGAPLHSDQVLFNGDSTFSFAGTLEPGIVYELLVLSDAGAFTDDLALSSTATAGYTFEFLPIPEPTTGALLLAGLVGLAARGRRDA